MNRIVISLLLLTSSMLIYSKENLPVIGIIPSKRNGQDTITATLSEEMYNNISTIIRDLGIYEVRDVEDPVTLYTKADFRQYSHQTELDSCLYYEIEREDAITVAITVYDLFEDRFTFRETTALPEFRDIFEIAEVYSLKAVERFSGIHIGYGNIRIKINEDVEDGEFSPLEFAELSVNGENIGTVKNGRLIVGNIISIKKLRKKSILWSRLKQR